MIRAPMGAFSETIEHWVSEYLVSTTGELNARQFGERAGAALVSFLEAACGSAVAPDELSEAAIPDGVAIGLGRLNLSDDERQAAPALLADLLAYLQASGRLAGGEALGAYAASSATAYLLKKQVRRATIKVGPNDPCPCGSGRKYKKCGMHG
ncbi:MAG: SEC-C domain-containing protein [Planctomycetes bacterium]|nr:SEC-C domain-containing protein [Planctomycetota bacterium]